MTDQSYHIIAFLTCAASGAAVGFLAGVLVAVGAR